MSAKKQIMKDALKRKLIDYAQKSGRMQTPMTALARTLQVYGALSSQHHALELFGMHGLWHTRDYVSLCASLELYEIDPAYAAYAQRTLPNTTARVMDSIAAVKEGKLLRNNYDLIVIDNPYGNIYGNDYAEHFDFFPSILRYIKNGVLVLNFLHGSAQYSEKHAERRVAFYGKLRPTVDEAVSVYKRYVEEAGLALDRPVLMYRNATVAYLAFVLRSK